MSFFYVNSKLLKKKKILVFLFCFPLLACDSVFTRFSHLNYECEKNIIRVSEIWITKKLQLLKGYVVINNTKYNLDTIEESEEITILRLNKPELKIEINKYNDTVLIFKDRNLLNLKCKRSYFKM